MSALEPTGETVILPRSTNSSGTVYHTRECHRVECMANPREVDRSVAEWKGYGECSACKGEDAINE